MKIYIHAGMPKCASTSIQAHFADREITNVNRGLLYPRSYRLSSGYRSHLPLCHHDTNVHEAIESMIKEAEGKRCQSIFVSSEAFSEHLKFKNMSDLYETSSKLFGNENVTTIFFLRDPIKMLRSSYQQFVKEGLWLMNKKNFFDNTDGSMMSYIHAFRRHFGFDWHEYSRFIEEFSDFTGSDKIITMQIDNPEERLLDKLYSLFDLPPLEDGNSARNVGITNAKLKFFKEFQNEFGIDAYNENKGALSVVNLSKINYNSLKATRDGVYIPDDILNGLFPNMHENFRSALEEYKAS